MLGLEVGEGITGVDGGGLVVLDADLEGGLNESDGGGVLGVGIELDEVAEGNAFHVAEESIEKRADAVELPDLRLGYGDFAPLVARFVRVQG